MIVFTYLVIMDWPAATSRGAVPLVTGGGNDPPNLVEVVERRDGINGTGAPTTETR